MRHADTGIRTIPLTQINSHQHTKISKKDYPVRPYFQLRCFLSKSAGRCRIIFESVVGDARFYALVCWGIRPKVADSNRLNKIIFKAGPVIGEELDLLMVVSEGRMLSKLKTILNSPSHPLYHILYNLSNLSTT